MNQKAGRPKATGNQYISISNLLKKFNINQCVPLPSSFIKKHNLFENYEDTKIVVENIHKQNIEIKEIDFNK